jgi:hypothetical protein
MPKVLVDLRNGKPIEMSRDLIATRWLEHLVKKLKGRYGLTEEQARTKAEVWLQWVVIAVDKEQPPSLVATEVHDERSPSRRDSHSRSIKARAVAATPLLRRPL